MVTGIPNVHSLVYLPVKNVSSLQLFIVVNSRLEWYILVYSRLLLFTVAAVSMFTLQFIKR